MTSLYELLTDKNTHKSYNKNKVKYSDVKNDFNNFVVDFDNFKTNNWTNNAEMNAIRHIGMSALLASKYGNDTASKYGTAYEALPQITSVSEPGDTKIDLYNNYVGRQTGLKFQDLTPQQALGLAKNLVQNTNRAALSPNDMRAKNMQYPTTIFQRIIGTIKN